MLPHLGGLPYLPGVPHLHVNMALPNIVKSREVHISSLVCNFWIFLSKFSSSFSLILYEKYIPNILTGLWNHFKSRGLFLLLSHFPNQSAFVFFTFRDKPAILPKFPTVFKAISKDSKSALNRVASSANWDSLISIPMILIPLTLESWRIFFESTSAERIKK